MAKKRTKPKTLSDQLRGIIETGPLTRYRIDKLGEVLKLRLESDLEN